MLYLILDYKFGLLYVRQKSLNFSLCCCMYFENILSSKNGLNGFGKLWPEFIHRRKKDNIIIKYGDF